MAISDLFGKNDSSITEEERLNKKLKEVLKEESKKQEDSDKKDSKKEDSDKKDSDKDQKTPDPKNGPKVEPIRRLAGAFEDLSPEVRKATFEHLLLGSKQVRAELTAIMSDIIKTHPTKYRKYVDKDTGKVVDATEAKRRAVAYGLELSALFKIIECEELPDGTVVEKAAED